MQAKNPLANQTTIGEVNQQSLVAKERSPKEGAGDISDPKVVEGGVSRSKSDLQSAAAVGGNLGVVSSYKV